MMMRAQLRPATINGAWTRQRGIQEAPPAAEGGIHRNCERGGAIVIPIQPALKRRKQKLSDSSDTEDILRVKAFLSGDEAAFEFLFEKYRQRVYGIAFRFVRNREDALEVAQEVFLRVYQALEKFKTDSKFFTWL